MVSTTSAFTVTVDPTVQRFAGGRVLLGGSPVRVLRLSGTAAQLFDRWSRGESVAESPAHRALADRLIRAGVAHPRPARTAFSARDVTAVVPVRDHRGTLLRLLSRLGGLARTVVVDDGSTEAVPGCAVRHPRPLGPAAARNAGWRLAETELVAFLDADTVPSDDWLATVLPHFADPRVVAVAPRVPSLPGPSLLQRYETARSPLDLGTVAGRVQPGTRIGWVPTAALVCRVSALRTAGGFADELRVGEDVDLVWRWVRAGGEVRYEPRSTVWHTPRPDWRAWARQRFTYGTSAAPLGERHGAAIAPVQMSTGSLAAWVAVAAGRPLTAGAVAGTTAALLSRKLRGSGVPVDAALHLALAGHWGAGRFLADAITRSWWPVALPMLAARRPGRWVLAAVVARYAHDWYRSRPPVDLLRWPAIRLADDLAHGAGVWWGVLRRRTAAPLLPRLSDWPGRRRRPEWDTAP